MSASPAMPERGAEPAGAPPERERPGCVLGIALGIFVLVGLVVYLVLPKGAPRDGRALLDAWFAAAPLAGWDVRDAALLRTGEEVVQLERAGAQPERALRAPVPGPHPPAAQPPATDPAGAPAAGGDAPPPAGASGGATARVDWGRLEQGPRDQPPRHLTFVLYPKERARAELARHFSDKLEVGSLDMIGPGGGRIVLELGTLPWQGGAAAYVVERDFERGGTFRDAARVDLSGGRDGLLLRAAWSRSEPFAKPQLEALLAGLRR